MRKFSGLLIGAMALAMVAGTSSKAEATAQLRLFDGTTTVTITDGLAGDANALAGVITFVGSIGDWTLNVTTGQASPFLGSPTAPEMDLNSVNTNTGSTFPDTLTISFTQQDYTALGGAVMEIGGTQTTCGAGGCSISYSAFWSATNNQFALTNQIGGAGGTLTSTASPFALTGGGTISGATPYSLTQVVTIVRNATGTTSFDAHLLVPEPASMALFGLGMLGFGMASRRRRTV